MLAHMLSLREIAFKYGITFRTLRYYEDQGLIRPIRHGLSRYYRPSDEARLQLILKGKRLSFSIKEIRKLLGVAPRNGDEMLPSDLVNPQSREGWEELDEPTFEKNKVDGAVEDLKIGLA